MTERIVKPRTRLVNFRLTEDEYQQLRQASLTLRSRGLSDFARCAILDSVRRMDTPEPARKWHQNEPKSEAITRINDYFASFETSLRRLLDMLNAMLANSPQNQG